MKYFDLFFDPQDEEGWELSFPWLDENGNWKDVWAYSRCERVDSVECPPVEVKSEGEERDFNIAGFNIPIISWRLMEMLKERCPNEVEFVPVEIESSNRWGILNVINRVVCLDFVRSILDFASPEEDGSDELPEVKGAKLLRIDPEPAEGNHVFRIDEWSIPIIISEDIADRMRGMKFTGFCLTPVS